MAQAFLLVMLFSTFACAKKGEAVVVREGVMDLRGHSFQERPIVDLDGTWEFYWKRLLTPEDFAKKNSPQPDLFLPVPDSWNGEHIAGQELPGSGFATYHAKILLPANVGDLALKILDAGSSYRLWVNGRLARENGRVGVDPASSIPSYKTTVLEIPAPGQDLDLVFQVANFQHRKGGLWESVKLGLREPVHNDRERRLLFAAFLAGSLVIMGLYHLGLFALRRKDFSILWFGLFCLDIALRTTLTGERILHGIIAESAWEWMVKAEYISMMMGTPLFLLFLRSLYPAEIHRYSALILILLESLLSVFVLFNPARIYSHAVLVNHSFLFAAIILSLAGLVRAVIHRREGSLTILLTSLVLLLTVINDVLYNQEIIFTFQMIGIGLFVFIFSQSFMLSLKFSRSFATSEALSEDLALQNVAYRRFVPREFFRLLNKENVVDLRLGDQVQTEMSILFVDIRSFTTLSEGMSPKESFDFLNDFLGRAGPLIRQSNGFIDKYLGDGLMALFPERPEDALRAAIEIQKAVLLFNEEMERAGRPSIRVGSAIHTGRLMLGTVGEQERMDGTVISDAVNLASRLEGLSRAYGVSIVISEETLKRLQDPTQYCSRFLGKVKVRGKTEPVSVFEVFDLDPREVKIVKQITKTEFEKGLLFLYEGRFEEACKLFEGILRANPEDRAAHLYVQKIEQLRSRPRNPSNPSHSPDAAVE